MGFGKSPGRATIRQGHQQCLRSCGHTGAARNSLDKKAVRGDSSNRCRPKHLRKLLFMNRPTTPIPIQPRQTTLQPILTKIQPIHVLCTLCPRRRTRQAIQVQLQYPKISCGSRRSVCYESLLPAKNASVVISGLPAGLSRSITRTLPEPPVSLAV